MATTADEILALVAPAFVAAVPDAADRADWIALAACEMDPTKWGGLYQKGLAYLTAHQWTKAGSPSTGGTATAGNPGAVSAETVGQVSRSYHGPSSNTFQMTIGDADLATTSYGMAYLRLRGQLGCAPFVVPC